MTQQPYGRMTAVVFDLDGTLIDTMTAAPAAYADTIRSLGGPDVSPADIVAGWHIGPTRAVLAHFLGRTISAGELECFYHHFEAAVATVQPFPGVVQMLDALSRDGYRLGVFTSATRRAATLTLATAYLDRFFSTVICGDDVSKPKPAPEGLQLACRNLGANPAESAYVGDAQVDLACAKAAGAKAVRASWGSSRPGVADPGCVAHRPSDIPDLFRRPAPQRARSRPWC